jgi:hypothetical protein
MSTDRTQASKREMSKHDELLYNGWLDGFKEGWCRRSQDWPVKGAIRSLYWDWHDQAEVDSYQRQLEAAEEPIAPDARRTVAWLVVAAGGLLVALLVGIVPAIEVTVIAVLTVCFLWAIDYMDRRH